MKICIFTSVCEEDKQWTDQYLKEVERLEIPFAILLDRCSDETKAKFNHPLCVARYEQNEDVEFTERLKQKIFDLIPKEFEWALALDIDEVLEKDAKSKLNDLPDCDFIDFTWVNLWEDDKHLRIGIGLGPRSRLKLYNLKNTWRWIDSVTNGAYIVKGDEIVRGEGKLIDVVCVHHGLKTKELRLKHKEKWDRIYTNAISRNPYKLWDVVLDESLEHEIIDNPYL